MTERECETVLVLRRGRILCLELFAFLLQEVACVFHELCHTFTAMVSCHVGVEVLPCSFDLVVVGAVWWKEVKR